MILNVERRQDSLLKSLKEFYKTEANMKKLVNILEKEGELSRRVLDFLCTNYAKKNDVMYFLTDSNGKKVPFHLHIQYRNQLKAYSKMLFDPFRRHERIILSCPLVETKKLNTTVAQLNFFRWAIEYKVLDWINDASNLKKVENDMTATTQVRKKEKLSEENKKRKELSKNLNRSARTHNVKITVSFV
jgi:hypothetical protein